MAELLAEGMDESLVFVACCTGVARTGTHSSIAAMSSFLRLSIDEVLLGFSIRMRRGKLALSSLISTHLESGFHFGNCAREVLNPPQVVASVQLPKSIQAAYLNRISPPVHVRFPGSNVNIF